MGGSTLTHPPFTQVCFSPILIADSYSRERHLVPVAQVCCGDDGVGVVIVDHVQNAVGGEINGATSIDAEKITGSDSAAVLSRAVDLVTGSVD